MGCSVLVTTFNMITHTQRRSWEAEQTMKWIQEQVRLLLLSPSSPAGVGHHGARRGAHHPSQDVQESAHTGPVTH